MAELIWIKDSNAAAVCASYSTYLLRSETGGSHCDSMVRDKIIPEAEHLNNDGHWMMQKTPFSHWSEIVTAAINFLCLR